MPHFTRDHVIILPHAEEYRTLYGISLDDVVLTINDPDLREGVSSGRYTAEKPSALTAFISTTISPYRYSQSLMSSMP